MIGLSSRCHRLLENIASAQSSARRWSYSLVIRKALQMSCSCLSMGDVVTRVGNVVQGIEVGFVRSVQPALQGLASGLHERLTMVLDFDAADFAVERRI